MLPGLPNDFGETLNRVQQQGILEEDLETVNIRLTNAVETAAQSGGDLGDLGFGDWSAKTKNLLALIHKQLCDKEKKCLKEDYKDILNLGLSLKGITTLSAIIAGLFPGVAISSVLIFAAIWLLKRGLNDWCSVSD